MKTHLVPFHGETITAFETPAGVYVAVAPLCERLGVSRQGQSSKLNADPMRWSCKMFLLETAAGPRETLCIPVNRIAAWLFTLNAKKVKPEAREALLAYQREAADVLDRHFRLRQREADVEIARLKAQQARMRAFTLAFNPTWNRIARLQEAGIERLQVYAFFSGKTKSFLGILMEDMEESGVIDREDWWGGMPEPAEPLAEPEQGEFDLTPIEAAQHEMARQFGG